MFFPHAISGYDITSTNGKFCNTSEKHDQLVEIACVFNKIQPTGQEIIKAGGNFIIALNRGCIGTT